MKKKFKIGTWTIEADMVSKGDCLDLHIYDGKQSSEGWLIHSRLVLVKR